ncbi:MAG: hypothetical protein WCO33_00990 [bacterium]
MPDTIHANPESAFVHEDTTLPKGVKGILYVEGEAPVTVRFHKKISSVLLKPVPVMVGSQNIQLKTVQASNDNSQKESETTI